MQFAPAFIVWLYRSGLQAGQNRNTTRLCAICMYINYIKLYNIISNQSGTDKKQNKNFNNWRVLHYLSICGHLYQSQGENATESRKRALFATISKRTQFAQSQHNTQSANKDLLRLYKTITTQHPTKHTQDRRKESQRARTGAGSGNGQAIKTHPTSTPGAHAHNIGVTPQAQNRSAEGSRSKIGGVISTNQSIPLSKNSPKKFSEKKSEKYIYW